ncbi:uncharacterized protein LOC141719772 [Apium graveolens]|uniref:uncharacterized protein LOC141719772 n=1 Tax=Apium graveolens TaxID=4045 RepID=UPI003D7924E4
MPIRFLKKSKDMYVKSMMDVAQKPQYGSSNMMGSVKTAQTVSSGLPKSLSTSIISTRSSTLETDQDLRDLIRANSASSKMGSLDVDLYLKQLVKEEQMKKLKELMERNNLSKAKSLKGGVPRSCSVAMGRIDEDKAYKFDEDVVEELSTSTLSGTRKSQGLYPRSTSSGFRKTTRPAGVF